MTQADGIILGTPVYAANISANMQAFLEWARVVTDMNRSENLFHHKVGAAVTAARRGGALTTLDTMLMPINGVFTIKICTKSSQDINQGLYRFQ